MLLAEVEFEGGQTEQAAKLAEPLVEWIKSQKPDPFDNTLLRMFLTTARVQLSLGELDKAAATIRTLVELGPDDAATNGVLVALVKNVGDLWKAAEAELIEAGTAGNAERSAAAQSAATGRKAIVQQLLAAIVPRKEQSLAAQIYIADTSAELDQSDTARDLYQAILARADADADFAQANAAALTRMRVQLVGLLRRKAQTEEEFQEGLSQVDQLIAEHPNALEPKMEKGRLLQAWADVDPERFKDAVAHWTDVCATVWRGRDASRRLTTRWCTTPQLPVHRQVSNRATRRRRCRPSSCSTPRSCSALA